MYTISELYFTWDDNKARVNLQKHGISFEEASTVFDDANAILFDDPDHSEDEDRFLLLGNSAQSNLLIVCHCYRAGEMIRIISARKATRNERLQYEEIYKGW